MKETNQMRKILYLGKTDIALIVLELEEKETNVLFANQVKVDSANLQVKVSELLTNAANFLGFNIKDVEIIFDDPEITRYSYMNQEFVDCSSEEEIAKEIFKKAKIDNYFVNEINFLGIQYDDIDKVAKVNCQICASNYITYKTYIQAVKACNVAVINSTNLYKLLKTNKDEVELTLKIDGNKAIACEYYGNKLNNVKVIELKMDEIRQHLSDKFNIKLDKVEGAIAVANNLVEGDNLDVAVVNNYDLKTKTYNTVKACDFIALYRDEVRTQINNYVDYRDFHNVRVISNNIINALEGFDFATNDQIEYASLSVDKIICLANLDMNKEITQFSFENKIKAIDLVA